VDSSSSGVSRGFAIRIIKDGKTGFSYTTDEKHFGKIIEDAIATSRYKIEDVPSFYQENTHIDSHKFYDSDLQKVNKKGAIELLQKAMDTALSFDRRVKKVRKGIFSIRHTIFSIRNSHGVNHSDERTDFYLFQEVIAEHNNDTTTSWEIEFSHFLKDIDPVRLGVNSARNAVGLLDARRIKTGMYRAIIKNTASAELLGMLGKSFLSEFVFKKRSKLANRIGEKIFSDNVTISDSGIVPSGWNSFSFDGEGVPSRETILVENGVLKGFLYDTHYGRMFNQQSTGNCRREGYSAPPRQDITNIFIKPGEGTLEYLIKEIQYGVLITGLMGVHTINPVTGDFSLGAEGYTVEKGSIGMPFRGVTVSGNIFSIFNNVVAIGGDIRFLFSAGSPSIMVDNLTIGGI